jgi:hypothetical protein
MSTDGLLKKTAILFSAMLALSLGIGYMLPGEFKVERTLVINASPEVVWSHINELSSWPKWDPWSSTDPDIKHSFEGKAGVGHTMLWSGPRSGQGRFETIESQTLKHIRFKLTVPQNSEARFLSFKLEDLGGKTRLTWIMDGVNTMQPIGNYFGLGMDRYIGPMYEQGLSNLKSLVEVGKVVLPPSNTRPSNVAAPTEK